MGSSDEQRRQQLGSEISALMGGLVRGFRGTFSSCADRLGLAPGEAQLLWLLGEAGHASTGDLAGRLRVDPANTSTLLTRLERRQLIRRQPAEHDRRRRVVSLTAVGRTEKEALARCMEQSQAGFSALTTPELRTFRDLLSRVAGED
jgi:DNA-binding MarR family transcriptional regulator